MLKRYIFRVCLQGIGETPWEAWNDAVDHFSVEPGVPSEEFEVYELDGNEIWTQERLNNF